MRRIIHCSIKQVSYLSPLTDMSLGGIGDLSDDDFNGQLGGVLPGGFDPSALAANPEAAAQLQAILSQLAAGGQLPAGLAGMGGMGMGAGLPAGMGGGMGGGGGIPYPWTCTVKYSFLRCPIFFHL
jgi:hypothetical protein